jgi:hypothetical protein
LTGPEKFFVIFTRREFIGPICDPALNKFFHRFGPLVVTTNKLVQKDKFSKGVNHSWATRFLYGPRIAIPDQ